MENVIVVDLTGKAQFRKWTPEIQICTFEMREPFLENLPMIGTILSWEANV